MTDSERLQKIREIKSFGNPPVIEEDLYYEHSPWCKFAIHICGICDYAIWENDEVIFDRATDEEIEYIYNYMKNLPKKQNSEKKIELKPEYFENITFQAGGYFCKRKGSEQTEC